MNIKELLQKKSLTIYRYILDNPLQTIFSFIILVVGFSFISTASISSTPIIYPLIYTVLLFLANYWKGRILFKYLFLTITFILFYIPVQFYGIEFTFIERFVYLFPLIYAYILPDLISPIILGILIAQLLSTYFGVIDSSHVANPIIGILSASIIFSATFYLLRKLINERDKYHTLSTTDSLTGLSTLKHFVDKSQKILDQNPVAAVLVIDLDHFKQINDTYGHLIGNKILIEISEILKKEMIDTSSIIGRLGGDEFVIFLHDIQINQVSKIAARLSLCFKNHVFYVNPALPPINVSLTIGEAYSTETKKLSIQELLNQADSNMYYKKHGEYKLAYNSMLDKIKLPDKCKQFLKTLEEKDAYTYIHSQYVAQYAAELAKALGFSEMKTKEIYISGLIHDIGKLYIPNGVLRKPGKLTQEEYTVIKDHVTDGLGMLKDLSVSEIALSGVKYHHERFDGKGYPNGIDGYDTPIGGRIIQIADAFSAMTIKRVYKESLSVEDAIHELIKNSGSQFDPELVNVFINLFKEKKSVV